MHFPENRTPPICSSLKRRVYLLRKEQRHPWFLVLPDVSGLFRETMCRDVAFGVMALPSFVSGWGVGGSKAGVWPSCLWLCSQKGTGCTVWASLRRCGGRDMRTSKQTDKHTHCMFCICRVSIRRGHCSVALWSGIWRICESEMSQEWRRSKTFTLVCCRCQITETYQTPRSWTQPLK